jgi:hypothetical protein
MTLDTAMREEVAILTDVLEEVLRADSIHGHFPTIQHAAAVLRREEQEAWAEVWQKPVNRTALRMELIHVISTGIRAVRLLDADGTLPAPGPFSAKGGVE